MSTDARAILFDLYETLVTEANTVPVRASSLGARLGLDGPAFRAAWKETRGRIVRGELSFAGALRDIGATLGVTVDPAVAEALSRERQSEKAALFRNISADALATLQHLRDSGYKLAVVSNCFAEDVVAWPTCAASDYFDTAVFSCMVGCAKPDPAIYVEALQRLGVPAANAGFIGDGGDNELLGAQRVGLRVAQATWYRQHAPDVPQEAIPLSSWSAVLTFAHERSGR